VTSHQRRHHTFAVRERTNVNQDAAQVPIARSMSVVPTEKAMSGRIGYSAAIAYTIVAVFLFALNRSAVLAAIEPSEQKAVAATPAA
jgi:hypothetical protein